MHYNLLVAGEEYEEKMEPYNESNENYYRYEYDHEGFGDDFDSLEDLKDAVKDAGLEFDEDLVMSGNPRGNWDWYSVGGRWMGKLKKKNGTEGRLGEGDLSVDEMKRFTASKNWVSQCRKGDLDIEGMRKKYTEKMRADYRKAQEITKGVKWAPYNSWDHKNHKRNLEVWELNPVCQALKSAFPNKSLDDIDRFMLSEEEYCKWDFLDWLRPYSFIDDDGEWWDETDEEEYINQFEDWWQGLGDDELITLIDYHN